MLFFRCLKDAVIFGRVFDFKPRDEAIILLLLTLEAITHLDDYIKLKSHSPQHPPSTSNDVNKTTVSPILREDLGCVIFIN